MNFIKKFRDYINKFNNMPVEVKSSLAYTFSNVLLKCLSFISLPIVGRMLSTEEYGVSNVYGSWLGIMSVIITLNLAYGSFSNAMIRFEDCREAYISSVQGIYLMLGFLFLAVYGVFYKPMNDLFMLPSLLVILLIFETIFSNSILLWTGKLRFEYKYKPVVALSIVMALLSFLLQIYVAFFSKNKSISIVLATSLVNVVFGFVIFIFNIIKGKKLYSKEFWKFAFSFNLPLIAYYFSQIIFNQSDKIMIDHYLGESETALYGVAYNFGMAMTFLLNAINNSFIPWLYERMKVREENSIKPVATMISLIMSYFLLLVVWFSPEILLIFVGEKYIEANGVVFPVALSVLLLFYAQLFINIEFFYESKISLVFGSIFSAVVNLLLNSLYIPQFGYVAAAYTTLVSYILFVLFNFLAMAIILRKRNVPIYFFDYGALFIVFCALLLIGLVGVMLDGFLVLRIIGFMGISVIFILYLRKIYIKLKN